MIPPWHEHQLLLQQELQQKQQPDGPCLWASQTFPSLNEAEDEDRRETSKQDEEDEDEDGLWGLPVSVAQVYGGRGIHRFYGL